MTKGVISQIVSAVCLAGYIEFYIWMQSSVGLDDNWTKTLLISLYFVLSVACQLFLAHLVGRGRHSDYGLNALVAVIISGWLTFSAFILHPGLAKGRHLSGYSLLAVFFRFLMTIGLVTFVWRLLTFGTAQWIIRRRKSGGKLGKPGGELAGGAESQST
jgi:hypothetical protein